MEDITLAEAKERLEELIARAASGEDVRILDPRHGSIRLTPADAVTGSHGQRFPPRVPGLMKDRVSLPDEDLLAPLTEEELTWLSGETSR